ncbi:hypothetical protein [Paenibacillus sp. GP183]|jgi:hypothetical protein|uniref:hypothetical protein n=1 Tax=Paenibacillus sp. GP183 TaxID=1882751 RepID=UPI0008946131|nr:hypothetical protein [Paenibacillus sp. GP183]SEB96909.1 hypothetical protein SAMN05443246_2515 [Paenibacillus sp. GP183]
MKIAYINQAPEESSLGDFMQEYRIEHGRTGLTAIKEHDTGHVISAYDNNRLVAIGYTPADASAPQMESAEIYVLPDYRTRGIESNVYKLLLAEWKYCPVTAAH